MADDVTLPGTGVAVAADDVAGKFYQKMKNFASSDGDARRMDQDRDAVAGATDAGYMSLGIRKDTATSMAGTDGDYTTSIFDGLGRMWISAAVVEDTPHASGDIGLTVYGVRRDVPRAVADDGDYMPHTFDAFGRLWVTADTTEKHLRSILQWLEARAVVEDELSDAQTDLLKRIIKTAREMDDAPTSNANYNIASVTSSTVLLPANPRRKGVSLFNDSTAVCYLSCKGAASTSNFNYYLAPGAHWELPFKHLDAIHVVWAAADGFARVGEWSA